MTGIIFVKRLNKSGTFVSYLDYSGAFAVKDNPKGYFKMIIQPLKRSQIRYAKVKGGYVVEGESYIISGPDEKSIDRDIKDLFKKDRFPDLCFVEDKSLVEWFKYHPAAATKPKNESIRLIYLIF